VQNNGKKKTTTTTTTNQEAHTVGSCSDGTSKGNETPRRMSPKRNLVPRTLLKRFAIIQMQMNTQVKKLRNRQSLPYKFIATSLSIFPSSLIAESLKHVFTHAKVKSGAIC
jgi:hypothetical protein